MAKTQLNVRVDEATAEAARARALQRGVSVNRYIEELVLKDAGEVGQTFVEAASDFMKQYERVFAEEFGLEPGGAQGRPATTHREGQPGTT
ncbi:toxin-antitoxin system HicB family antitoxin [Streptomyces inhibens]|uniref:Toxin-antitoxin system HicB family antitoxin n=1 Tax=Streptomyces inhibens TaxID=2293571 RepID=A0A371PWM5_STRIH|nr:toxin-antitoxin system HicB family antitoxin [Streptomyces inhibens]REK86874.1 toxin-antitoxin system HicB family antitoxin [Streptomyces inhibens]